MDPNYRRNEPGLSPMGMELVPVYEGNLTGSGDGEPALQIDPAIVNNIGVRTELVRRSDLALDIRTVGHVMADEEQVSDVHVRSEGWIERLAVEAEGEAVERGDLLFQIYSPNLVAAQSEYLQAVRLGRPSLLNGATQRLTALGMSEGQIARLRESGSVNRLVAVYAPQSGVVTALKVREGMFIRPSDNTMSLADLSTVWILANVFETQADWVAAGQRAVMTLTAFPGESWEGEVDYVYPTAESRARTISVRLRVLNPGLRLKPNMYADILIEAAPKEDVLIIPQAALIRSSQGDRVILALGNGRFRPAQVRAGIESGDYIEILEGLEENERIVTSSHFLIDSEASFDATLLRLSAANGMEGGTRMAAAEGGATTIAMDMVEMDVPAENGDAISAVGRIQSVDEANRSIMLTHEPIPELSWPSMTMGFSAADNLPIESFEEGAAIRFEFRQTDDGFEILSLEPLAPEAAGGGGP
jgi:Cu(I)/Ag(I) efflux system membrane fusion protein